MDTFAYTTLGTAGALLLIWVIFAVVTLWREDGIGQAVILACAGYLFVGCVIVSVIWLIGTKVL